MKLETDSLGESFDCITPRTSTPDRDLDTGSEKFIGISLTGPNKSIFAVQNQIPEDSRLGGSEAPKEKVLTAAKRKSTGWRKDRTPADLLKEQLKDGLAINHEESHTSSKDSLDEGKFLGHLTLGMVASPNVPS